MAGATYARISLAVFPLVLAGFAALYVADAGAYTQVLDEDGPVEWATVVLLAVASVLAFVRARRDLDHRSFLALLGALLAFAVLEELSWGQRLFGIESPAFFLRYSDQQEINVHNVFQPWAGFTIKWIAAVGLSAYGIALPLLVRRLPTLAAWIERWGILVPPRVLIPGFVTGALLMLDLPTNDEEEIAEFVYALCFVLLLAPPPQVRTRRRPPARAPRR